tara:strand:- start:289 stop:558 length:270 start_codon:yes stop_codon:yes gene_type:complete
MKNFLWSRKLIFITAVFIIAMSFCAADVCPKNKKARFYDFSDQLIDGQIKKPSTLYMDSRTRAKFGKLLLLKKSFRNILIVSAKDPILK